LIEQGHAGEWSQQDCVTLTSMTKVSVELQLSQ